MLYYYLCERSMPWARSFCPLPLLYPSASDFQFPSAGDRWFRACGVYMRNLYYGNYNFSYYSFFLRGYKGLKVVTICYYKYLYINIYNYIFIYTFLYLHFKSVILGQNKTVITEIVICNRFFSGIEMHTFIAPKTMTISSQSYELWPAKRWVIFFNIKL